MTGQISSPRAFAASISSTAVATRASTTAKTSCTVRPEAAMRARIAGLICRIAAFRSAGVVSQCGSGGGVACSVRGGEVTVTVLTPFRKDSLLGGRPYGRILVLGKSPDYTRRHVPGQAVAGAAPVADRRAR